MTKLDRLRESKAQLLDQYRRCASNHRPLEAAYLRQRLDAIEVEIRDAETYAPRRLAEQLSPEQLRESGICKDIVKTHMAADYLCDVCFRFREKMDRLGFADCSLYPMISRMEKLAAEYAALVCHPEFAGLQDFMVTNDEFIRDLDTLTDRHLNTHLRITYDAQSQNQKIKYQKK